MTRAAAVIAAALLAGTAAAGDQAPQITSSDQATFTVDSSDVFNITTSGSPTPNISTDDPLPSGLSFNDNGDGTATISGTPQANSGGSYAIFIRASNGIEPDAMQQLTITVNELAAFTSDDHTTFIVGTNGQFAVTIGSGYPTPSLCFCPTLPPSGVTFTDNGNGTGSLHGTAGAGTGGTYELTVVAINQAGEAYQYFTLEIDQAPAITSANNATFHVDTGASFTVSATGFPAPALSESGALPNGITFNPATGVLSGTAAFGTAGAYPISFTASNGAGSNAVQNFTLTVTQPLPCTPPPSGLVGWWPGDGSAIDVQNDNNGALQGSANFANGRVGQAFDLNGTNGYVSIGNPEVLKLLATDATSHTGITVDAWVKPNALPSNGSLVAVVTKWNSNNSTGASADAYGLFLANNNGTLEALAQLNPGGTEVTLQGGIVPLNAFTHIAMTFETNSGGLALFVNGVQVDTRIVDGSIVRSDVNVMIGRENDNTFPRFFAGLIDEVEIYDRALSSTEISAIYNAGANGTCKSLPCVAPTTNIIGWWPGDNTAIDIQGGNNGTLQGNAAFAAGKVGQAFIFGGGNDGVEIPSNQAWDFGPDSFTIDTWVRLDGFTSYGILAAHEQTGSDDGWLFLLNGFSLDIAFNRSNAAQVFDFVPTLKRWYHLAVTRSGNTFKFYVDGVQFGTDQTSAAIPSPINGPLKIGKANGFQSLTGRIDEFEIIHRALTASEIQAIYNAGRAGKCEAFTMYVSNNGSNTIEKFDAGGNDLGSFATTGLSGPTGLAFDAGGNLYVANNTNSTIQKFDATGADLGTFAAAGLTQPIGLAFDANGNLYVANNGSNTVRKFSPTGTDLGVFATGTGLSNPYGISFDSSGKLYVVNDANSSVRKFDAAGADLGNFAVTGLNNPRGIAFDRNGLAYVSNAADHSISKFDNTGGSFLFGNSGFNVPLGLAFDSSGNLYAVNNGNNTVVNLGLGGVPSVFANGGLDGPYFIALKPISPLVPVLKNDSISRPTNGHVMIGGQALPNATVYIQATANLQDGFSTLGTTTADGNGVFQFDDTSVGSATTRFYRASYP